MTTKYKAPKIYIFGICLLKKKKVKASVALSWIKIAKSRLSKNKEQSVEQQLAQVQSLFCDGMVNSFM